jgi:hypothetical protein
VHNSRTCHIPILGLQSRAEHCGARNAPGKGRRKDCREQERGEGLVPLLSHCNHGMSDVMHGSTPSEIMELLPSPCNGLINRGLVPTHETIVKGITASDKPGQCRRDVCRCTCNAGVPAIVF